jgi:hypothetical protein
MGWTPGPQSDKRRVECHVVCKLRRELAPMATAWSLSGMARSPMRRTTDDQWPKHRTQGAVARDAKEGKVSP